MSGHSKIEKIMNTFPIKPLGVSIHGDMLTFSVSVPNTNECVLKLYCQSKTNPVKEYKLTEEHQIGSVFTITLNNNELNGADSYLYEVLGKEFVDPYAVKVSGREVFGDEKTTDTVLGKWNTTPFNWETDAFLYHKFNEMILYKLHVRGFTMNERSGVKHKGTYRGIVEKLPYLKELGVNAVLLMPCVEFEEVAQQNTIRYGVPKNTLQYITHGTYATKEQEAKKAKVNYWGYTTQANYFSPKASYASNVEHAWEEFCFMVKECHQAGIEVLMEMNFGKEHTLTFIIDCLRYWRLMAHVDGFHIVGCSEYQKAIAMDPVLEKTKLLCSYWDTNAIYENDVEPRMEHLADYNDDFMITMRRFLKGDEEQVGPFMEQFKKHRSKQGVVNYITNHDGFTLADVYSYDIKHNQENGENSHDGTDYNYSWNCGIEGNTRKKKITTLRLQMMENALTLLLLSQGIPMILAGDEFGNSQLGNNNAYCQDNEIGWIDWKKKTTNKVLLQYTKQLIQLRKDHKTFHNSLLLRGMDYISCGTPDISFHGVKAWYPDYSNYSRTVAVLLSGEYAIVNRKGDSGASFYVICNMHWEKHTFDLPHLEHGTGWKFCLATNQGFITEDRFITEKNLELPPRTIVVLMDGKSEKGK